jgi:hypothetical protein
LATVLVAAAALAGLFCVVGVTVRATCARPGVAQAAGGRRQEAPEAEAAETDGGGRGGGEATGEAAGGATAAAAVARGDAMDVDPEGLRQFADSDEEAQTAENRAAP